MALGRRCVVGLKAQPPPVPQLGSGLGCSGAGSDGSHSDRRLSAHQNEMLNRQIQKEIWRIQDVMEGLRKNNPSRGTDTAKHRGEQGLCLPLRSTSPSVPWLGTSLVPGLPRGRRQHLAGGGRTWFTH